MIVAPLVGAWIEMELLENYSKTKKVAPLVGAWIEIGKFSLDPPSVPSLPSWERGLKWR